MIRILSIFIISAFISCEKYPENVRKALLQSGNNRIELEEVLSHYSKNPADSLKFRAAKFLIGNMPGHYSIGGEEVDRYVAQVDSMYPNLRYYIYPSLYLKPYYAGRLKNKPEKRYDIDMIKADFLIKHIDFKFALKDAIPWGGEISFDLFCETILPYRVDVEPLKNIPTDSLHKHIAKFKDVILDISGFKQNATTLRAIMADLLFGENLKIYQLPSPMLYNISDCVTMAIANKCEYSWIGLPSFICITPQWADKDNRHHWNSIVEFGDRSFEVSEITNSVTAKVYYKTYSHNEYAKGVFNTQFLKDVTNKYLNCRDITLEVDKNNSNSPIYLCVFNEREWKPVAWTQRQGKKATFNDIAYNVLYLPTTYENETMVAISEPFYVDLGGKICTIGDDDISTQKLRLTRKYPINDKQIYNINSLVGITIESSNESNFQSFEQIDSIIIKTLKPFYECVVDIEKEYRYWRVRNNRYMTLSEIRFYDEDGAILKENSIFDTQNDGRSADKLFDGSLLTCGFIRNWVGMDFGKTVKVSKIEIVPQNDANYIYPGDVYELCYFNKSDWITHEIKEANDYYIEFDNVPTNRLYWLRNITEGKEERPFTYDNDIVRFW